MSKDDSNGGFLSKVARFVRNPTTSWTDLDTRIPERESGYSKTALKELIERKRRNDFVRKREFDMLRKIRSREGTTEAGQGLRPSFFQSSLPARPDDRVMTLKKIDDIEAQMSMQWWKTKSPDSLAKGSGQLGSDAAPLARRGETNEFGASDLARAEHRARQYANTNGPSSTTGHETIAMGADESLRPEPIAKDSASADTVSMLSAQLPSRTGLVAISDVSEGIPSDQSDSFSASRFFALNVQAVAQGPEVEEAAIRFANGDDSGAEQGLAQALSEGGARVDKIDDWLALFDLYRATGQLAPFESRAVDFVNRFSRSAPQWYDMPELMAQLTGKTYAPSSASARAVWVSEPKLDTHAVGTLQKVLSRAPQPWVLDWSPLESIDIKAARALLGMFTLWGDQALELRCLGIGSLRGVLNANTPSGRSDVEQLWWELRMAVLRVMNLADEFELTALDFCVTYEVSPPGWESPRCHFQSLVGEASSDGRQSVLGESVLGDSVLERVPSQSPNDSWLDSQQSDFNQVGLVELSGEIRGDPQAMLEALEQRLVGADVMIISCRNLIRVDFSAAGTLLNWASGHHANGRMVQFVDAHRLISAFFHVVGITELARVVLRND
jgi:anti-anti-sigma regulatory factor